MTRGRPRHRVTLRAAGRRPVALALVATVVLAAAGPAAGAATGGAGASGSGDEIISSILAAASGPRATGRDGRPPACWWHTLTDVQVVFLVHVAASRPELLTAAFLEQIDRFTNLAIVAPPAAPPAGPADTAPPTTAPADPAPTGPAPTPPVPTTAVPTGGGPAPPSPEPAAGVASVTQWRISVRICGGVARTMELRSRTVTDRDAMVTTYARGLARRTTLLPPPEVVVSPPPRGGRAPRTVVGEPVFWSTDPPPPVRSSLPYGGRTVDVRAEPADLEVFTGEPSQVGRTVRCGGFGRAFDPASGASPAQQARAVGACTTTYRQATGAPRRDGWLGYVRLNWRGEFRVDGGPAQPLDGLFSPRGGRRRRRRGRHRDPRARPLIAPPGRHSKLRPHSRRKSTSAVGASGAARPARSGRGGARR